ncbi:hypothetical protein CORC01_12568 [Colletotrichum orchidophilum]|uniref:Uncharacterized protein n=1 Tax=Colletotrichum orchidophilum TaxID=1209926 RepID=A0A1G4ASP7_9PEZI|nr:uncharacterized protein CORC01_12568 [Colletotrichum orchidophilum]OHE92113.1 hypothetical protein CORC01_12568 [Colletotrichum orchidophilum]
MVHVRNLFKPGGYRITRQVTGEFFQKTLLMGGLLGWWLGIDKGCIRGSDASFTQWDSILHAAGSSGTDKYVTDLTHSQKQACSVIVAQAVDERFHMLRDPFSCLNEVPLELRLLITGGKTLSVSRMAKGIESHVSRFRDQILRVDSVDATLYKHAGSMTSEISLTEVEKPCFPSLPRRGTSLLLMMLQSAIRPSMGVAVSPEDMYHASPPQRDDRAGLAAKECELRAKGFVGSAILALSLTGGSKGREDALRGKSTPTPRRHHTNDKIATPTGSLLEPQLGISPETNWIVSKFTAFLTPPVDMNRCTPSQVDCHIRLALSRLCIGVASSPRLA